MLRVTTKKLGNKIFKNKLIASLIILILTTLVLLVTTFIYPLFYTTTPQDLTLQIAKDSENFKINGQWNKKHEKYAYGKDYIAILTPADVEIINTSMKPFTGDSIENRYLLGELKEVLEKKTNYDSTKQLYLFEIKLEQEFSVHFKTSRQVSSKDLIIQYIHVYYPPMDSFEYWVKTVDGLISDPLNMYR